MNYLKPGGRILVSVPAHARKYGRCDEIVGHLRRYEKRELRNLLVGAGVEYNDLINYEFPLTEWTRPISNWLTRGDHGYEDMSPEQRSIRGAQARPQTVNRVPGLCSGHPVAPFVTAQRWLYGYDLGDGYAACGIKKVE